MPLAYIPEAVFRLVRTRLGTFATIQALTFLRAWGVGMSQGSHHSRGLQLVEKMANAFRTTDWTLNQFDPDGLRYR